MGWSFAKLWILKATLWIGGNEIIKIYLFELVVFGVLVVVETDEFAFSGVVLCWIWWGGWLIVFGIECAINSIFINFIGFPFELIQKVLICFFI